MCHVGRDLLNQHHSIVCYDNNPDKTTRACPTSNYKKIVHMIIFTSNICSACTSIGRGEITRGRRGLGGKQSKRSHPH